MLAAMTHACPTRPDHDALAASLRSWALAFVAWLAEAVGALSLTRSMRKWAHAQLAQAEKGAAALIVFAAIRLLPAPPDIGRRGGVRPPAALPGFARVVINRHDMRGVHRALFPRERDLVRRSVRLADAIRSLGACARRIARRISRILPATRLCAVRPPPARLAGCAPDRAPCAPDSS